MTNEATQAASTCHGETAVARDPELAALPSSADDATSPALPTQRNQGPTCCTSPSMTLVTQSDSWTPSMTVVQKLGERRTVWPWPKL